MYQHQLEIDGKLKCDQCPYQSQVRGGIQNLKRHKRRNHPRTGVNIAPTETG